MKTILRYKSTHHVKGFGSVKFHLNSSESILLHLVMYILVLKKNLVSIFALEEKSVRVSFIKGKVLTWPMESCMRDSFALGSRVEGLHRFNGISILEMVHDTYHQSELWHQTLAHLHYEAVPKLKKLVFRMPNVQASNDGVCSRYTSGNKKRVPFPYSRNKKNDILQLIHSNLCGPIPMHYIGCHLYYIICIDDFSRKKRIYYLKN